MAAGMRCLHVQQQTVSCHRDMNAVNNKPYPSTPHSRDVVIVHPTKHYQMLHECPGTQFNISDDAPGPEWL